MKNSSKLNSLLVSTMRFPARLTFLDTRSTERSATLSWLSVISVVVISIIMTLIGELFPIEITRLFIDATPEVLSEAPMIYRIYFLAFLFMGMNVLSTYYLQLHYGTVFITANYFIAVMLPVMFAGSLRRPRAWAQLAGRMLLSCAGMELCGVVLYTLLGDANLQPFVGGVVITAAAALLTRSRSPAARLAMGMGYTGMFFLTLGITMMVGNIRVEEDFDLQRALVLLNLTLILLLTLLFRRFSRMGDPAPALLAPLAAVSAASCVFGVNGLFAFLPLSAYTALPYSLVLMLALAVLYCSAFALPVWLRSNSQAQAERFLRQASENTLTVLREDLEHYNRVRHDMKNWSDQLMPPHMTLACENQTLAIILNMESAKARRAGVELDARVLAPAQLHIADPDLCSLLVNLIDNAVEYLAPDDAPAGKEQP